MIVNLQPKSFNKKKLWIWRLAYAVLTIETLKSEAEMCKTSPNWSREKL